MNPRLSVVIPVYNEEKRFENGFAHFFDYLIRQKYPWELIFVNDGSKDNTENLLRKKAKTNKNIKIVSYSKNRGKGYAIVQGVLSARGKYILFSDLDHSVPISTVETFFEYFEKGNPVVIGSRRVKGAQLVVRQPILREALGRGFTLLVNIIIYWGIADCTCGFKAFENDAAKRIFSKLSVYGWAFDAEIIYLCNKYKIKFAQAPVSWSDVSGSKVKLKRDILGSLKGLLQIRLNDLKGRY